MKNDVLLEARRRWTIYNLPFGPLRDCYSHPLPRANLDYRDTDYLALDLETTGLFPVKDQILSFGWVPIDGNRIRLEGARHRLVRAAQPISADSAVIHQITDDQAAEGEPLKDVLADCLRALGGRVLVAHHARIELGFLAAACRQLFGQEPLLRVVDTLALARRSLERRQQAYRPADVRLHALAEHYNLPQLAAHNALSDALNTAQVFLAQSAYLDTGKPLLLRDLLT
ncbi:MULTISPECIES: 3'-5' exonuclease [Thiorhodovibrio]|uniref:3'-5' exonuclease n=1 Tax=Thiorhodovibrio TaxID=61593 RepID=UPI0019128342|nr:MULTISPECIES: exonuclease domain-containing protein [Thiorhodovibrio]MBK5968849.1 DNA polymerase III subunit epsilon [Thiorhodovibrio winogradskyi]WPL12619.1 DNA polymerase III PolC-type [Thiorhodovibrio litoralis]